MKSEQHSGSASAVERPTPLLKPFSYSIRWCSAEESLDEADIAFGSVIDWIERGGGFMQSGSVGQMDAEDVVPRSPLAKALA